MPCPFHWELVDYWIASGSSDMEPSLGGRAEARGPDAAGRPRVWPVGGDGAAYQPLPVMLAVEYEAAELLSQALHPGCARFEQERVSPALETLSCICFSPVSNGSGRMASPYNRPITKKQLSQLQVIWEHPALVSHGGEVPLPPVGDEPKLSSSRPSQRSARSVRLLIRCGAVESWSASCMTNVTPS